MRFESVLAALFASASLASVNLTYAQTGENMEITIIKPQQLEQEKGAPFADLPFMKAANGTGGLVKNPVQFTSADGKLTSGPASFEKMTLEIDGFPVDEFMYLIEGEIEITDAAGNVTKVGPGDAFVMPKGFKGTWRQLSPIKKFAVTYAPGE